MSEQGDSLEPVLQEAAKAYHQPPPTPQHELWLQLQHARAIRRPQSVRRWGSRPLMGIAAALALGVGLGRLSVRQSDPAPAPAAPVAQQVANASPFRIAVAEHLDQAEVFLTLFRVSVRRGTIDSLTSATARPLLATNRLLLDSPAGADPKIRLLLEDLELVLAQIAQLSSRPDKQDLELVTRGIAQTKIMTRLWRQAPVGTYRQRS